MKYTPLELGLMKARMHYFFVLVDETGNPLPEAHDTLNEALRRSDKIIPLTAAEMAYYWPGRSRSFRFADVTVAEMNTYDARHLAPGRTFGDAKGLAPC